MTDDFGVLLEPGFPSDVAADLAARGHAVEFAENCHPFGGAQIILATAHGYVAGSDHRKEGHAAGF